MDQETATLEQKAINQALNSNWKEAIKLNKQLLKLGHKTVGVYNRLGKALSETEKWDNAIKAFEKALKIDPLNSVAKRGLDNAKMDRKAGSSAQNLHKETLLKDLSTSRIIELPFKKGSIDVSDEFVLQIGKKTDYYFLINSNGKKVKRVSRSKLNLKSEVYPKEIKAKVIEVHNDVAKLKLTSEVSVFRGEKQQEDPSLELKEKAVLAEKKELEKLFEEEREE